MSLSRSRTATKKKARKRPAQKTGFRRSLLELLENRQMLTVNPRILDLSFGHAALYEGEDFTLTARIDPLTAVSQVKFYADFDDNGVLNTSVDTLLATSTMGTGDQWSSSSIHTGSTYPIVAGRQLFFAQAIDSTSVLSNVLAMPAEVLSTAPVLRPIDNDMIVVGRRYVMNAHADLPPGLFSGGAMSYELEFPGDNTLDEPLLGISFDVDTGTLIWEADASEVYLYTPYHFRLTATFDDGSTEVESVARDFYLTVMPAGQVLSDADGPDYGEYTGNFNNETGPIFYDYRSSQSEGLRRSLSANIAPAQNYAPSTLPPLNTLTYDTATDAVPIIEADIPVDWMAEPTADFLTAKVTVLDHDGVNVVAQSDLVYYTMAGVNTGQDQYFHLAIPVDASSLSTGKYQIRVDLKYLNSGGTQIGSTQSFGSSNGWANADLRIANRSGSEVGNGWAIAGLSQLFLGHSDGAMLISGNGDIQWFAYDSLLDTYEAEEDSNLRLEKVGGTLHLISPDSSYDEFELTTGNLLAKVDYLGNRTEYEYFGPSDNASGEKPNALKSVTDPYLRAQSFSYDSNGRVSAIADFAGRTTSLYYTSGNLTQISHANYTELYTYGGNGLLSTYSDALGATTTYEYDNLSRLTRTVAPDGTYEVVESSDTSAVAARAIVRYASSLPVYLGSSITDPAPLLAWSIDNFGVNVADNTFMGAMGRVINAAGDVTHFTTDVSGLLSSITQFPNNGFVSAPWQQGPSTYSLHDQVTHLLTVTISVSAEDNVLLHRRYVYDTNFNLIEVAAANAPYATEIWDYTPGSGPNTFNRLQSYTKADGALGFDYPDRETIYAYDSNGLLETVTDPTSKETDFTYTDDSVPGVPAGLLVTVTDPNANTTKYEYYSAADSLGDTNLPSGSLAKAGLLKRVTVAFGSSDAAVVEYDYDEYGNVRQRIEPGDRVTAYVYDDDGRLLQAQQRGFLSAQVSGPTSAFTYNELGQLTASTDPNGNRVLYLYGLNNQLANVAQPHPDKGGLLPGPQTLSYYTPLDQLDTTIDPLGRWTTYEYDRRGQLISYTGPDPSTGLITSSSPTVNYTYNDAGKVETIEDPAHSFLRYDYNAWGQVSQIRATDAANVSLNGQSLGMMAQYEYNNFGAISKVTVPIDGSKRSTTEYVYDDSGRIEYVYLSTPTSGSSSRNATDEIYYHYEYDDGGRLEYLTAPSKDGIAAGAVTSYVYDHRNRVTSITLPEDASSNVPTTQYTYDDVDFEYVKLTDPSGNVTTWHFDEFNFIDTEVFEGYDPGTSSLTTIGTRSYEHDDNGNVIQMIDRDDRKTVYEYDALNRFTDEWWYETTIATLADEHLSWNFDWGGRLTSSGSVPAHYAFSYDKLDRVTSSVTYLDGISSTGSVTLNSEYDIAGNRELLKATIGTTADFVNTYAYDGLGRAVGILQEAQSVSGANEVAVKQVGLIYSDHNGVKQLNRFNQEVTTPDDDTTQLTDSGVVGISVYDFDYAGRLTDLDHSIQDFVTSSISQDWNYDYLNRVTDYTNSADSAVNGGVTNYDYDDLGQVVSADAPTSQSYSYDESGNRSMTGYSVDPGNRLASDGRYEYQYSVEGNLTYRLDTVTDRVLILAWDHRNRLTAIIEFNNGDLDPIYELRYEYDAFNRRVSRTETTNIFAEGGEGGSTIVDSEVLEENYIYDGSHVVLDFQKVDEGDFELAHRYLYGPAVDQLLAQENVAEDLEDASRVFWTLTDNLGTVRDLIDHEGDVVEHYTYDAFGKVKSGDTSLTRYLYTGREFDSTTGLQYNRERWYDPSTGRWLSEDPLGFSAGDSNLYRYVGNSPTNATDPSGLIIVNAGTGAAPNLPDNSGPPQPSNGAPSVQPRNQNEADILAALAAWRAEGGEGSSIVAAHNNGSDSTSGSPYTISLGPNIGGTLPFVHGGLSFDFNLGMDHILIPMEFSFAVTVAGGLGVGASGSAGVHTTVTNADSVDMLSGNGNEFGGEIEISPVGGAYVVGNNGSRETYTGVQINYGPTVGGSLFADNTNTTATRTLLFPWNPNARWWFGLDNPFR